MRGNEGGKPGARTRHVPKRDPRASYPPLAERWKRRGWARRRQSTQPNFVSSVSHREGREQADMVANKGKRKTELIHSAESTRCCTAKRRTRNVARADYPVNGERAIYAPHKARVEGALAGSTEVA